MTGTRKDGHHGRKRYGDDRLVRATVTISPSTLDAVDVLVESGMGKRATVLRGLLMGDLAVTDLDALGDDDAGGKDDSSDG